MKQKSTNILMAIEDLKYPEKNKLKKDSDVIHKSIYSQTLNNQVKELISNKKFEELLNLWKIYDRALNEAREKRMIESLQLQNTAKKIQEKYVLDPLFTRLANVAALPVIGYIHYKEKDYIGAESLLLESIKNDKSLIKSGINILEFHRVQQLHNLARIYFKQEFLSKGSKIINIALTSMLQGGNQSFGKNWFVDSLGNVAKSLRSDMLEQIVLETVGVFINYIEKEEKIYKIAFNKLLNFDPLTVEEVTIKRWFELLECNYNNIKSEKIILENINYLRSTPSTFDILKLPILINLKDLLIKTGNFDDNINFKLKQFGSNLNVFHYFSR